VVRTRHTITALSCHGPRIAVADSRDGVLLYTFREVGAFPPPLTASL